MYNLIGGIMELFLDTSKIPQYNYSSYKLFIAGEKHITRYCADDVLIIMLGGTLRFCEDGEEIELKNGEYYIQRAGLYQQGLVRSDEAYYFYIHFKGEWCEKGGIPHRGTYPTGVLERVKKLDKLGARMASIVEKEAVLLDILSLFISSGEDSRDLSLAQKIAEILRNNIKNGITVSEIAKMMHYSENYIIRVFKKEYSRTPHEYLKSLRLEQAVLKLKYTDLSLAQIAEECGFCGYVNFYKAYKKEFGKSPRE